MTVPVARVSSYFSYATPRLHRRRRDDHRPADPAVALSPAAHRARRVDLRLRRHSGRLRELAGSDSLRAAFPGESFEAFPPLETDPAETHEDAYRRAVDALPPRSLVVVATPETTHFEIARYALLHEQHVLAVKPFVMTYRELAEIRGLAKARGLWVGIEYHKRFDRRALEARGHCRAGNSATSASAKPSSLSRIRTAIPISRIGSRRKTPTRSPTSAVTTSTSPASSRATHPLKCRCAGIKGVFPNGQAAYLWTAARVGFNNGAILSVINGLGYPDAGAGSNDQGMTLFFEGRGGGAMIHHADQYRGVQHCYLPEATPPGGQELPLRQPRLLPPRALGGRGVETGRLWLRLDRSQRPDGATDQ